MELWQYGRLTELTHSAAGTAFLLPPCFLFPQ